MKAYDISPTLSSRTGVFPGDTAFSRNVAMSFEAGHHLGLSAVTTTLHVGAHADAPSHYDAKGVSIDRRNLDYYVGRCWVAHARVERDARFGFEHLTPFTQAQIRQGMPERFLVYTGTFPDPNHWNSDFASFDPALIERLAEAGVKLIGLDTPSIDPETSKSLDAHKTIARLDLSVLEGLCLKGVPEGEYLLMAQPLKIGEGDAGLVRALLYEAELVPRDGVRATTWIDVENA